MLEYVILLELITILLLVSFRKDSIESFDQWPSKPKRELTSTNLEISNLLSFVSLVYMWFLTAFRGISIGNDTSIYVRYFNIFSKEGINLNRTFELGYQFLNVIISKFTNNPHVFIIVVSTIMYAIVTIYIIKYSKNISMSVVMFFTMFFSIYLSALRQGIAMLITLFAYQMLKKNKKVLAALTILIASLFHTSSLICFLLFFDFKIKNIKPIAIIGSLIIVFASITGLVGDFVQLVLPRYYHYITGRYAGTGWLAVTYQFIRSLFMLIFVSINTDINDKEDRLGLYTNIYSLLIIAGGYTSSLITRIAEYFILINIVEFPNLIYKHKPKNYRLLLFIYCLTLIIMFVLTIIFRPNWNNIYPYEFWR